MAKVECQVRDQVVYVMYVSCRTDADNLCLLFGRRRGQLVWIEGNEKI